jgi:hypothetical protein
MAENIELFRTPPLTQEELNTVERRMPSNIDDGLVNPALWPR